MRAVISPGRVSGTVEAPPSKSMAHRMLIAAGLSRGTSVIRRLDPSEDILATVDCLRSLGAEVTWEGNAARVKGCDPRLPRPDVPRAFSCRESGSTLRFMIPLCLLSGEPAVLYGSEKLMSRPLSVYETLCRERGILFEKTENALRVEGRLTPGAYRIPGDVSSQFVTGLLFALPFLDGDSEIRLIPPVESRPYLDMTVGCLGDFGVGVRWSDERTLAVPGNSVCLPRDAEAEGDFSNAAFFEAFNYTNTGSAVTVTGLPSVSRQGDRVYAELFPRLAEGPCTADIADCPDLAPVLFAVAALCHGGLFTGTRRLRFKESDRGEAMACELAKFGIETERGENWIRIVKGSPVRPAVPLSSHNDHRIAMALSVLCAVTGGEIAGAEAVKKSFPEYWNRLKALGAHVELKEAD